MLQQDGKALVVGGMDGAVAHAWKKERIVEDSKENMRSASIVGGSLSLQRRLRAYINT